MPDLFRDHRDGQIGGNSLTGDSTVVKVDPSRAVDGHHGRGEVGDQLHSPQYLISWLT